MPIYFIYGILFETTESIILNFRYIYTLLWAGAALFFYFRLRSFSKSGASFASLTFLLYAPYGIMALSYNSLGILMLLNACIIVSTAEHYQKLQYFISGVFYAAAVICCPYLAILYLLLSFYVLINLITKRYHKLKEKWICLTAGIMFLAALFIVFILSRAEITEIIRNLPFILNDPEHSSISFTNKMSLYFSSVFHATSVSPYFWITAISAIIISMIFKRATDCCFLTICWITILYLLDFDINNPYLNFVMLPLCIPGIFAAIHSNDKRVHILSKWILIPGIIFTFCLNFTSNQQIYSISSAAAVTNIACIMILVIYVTQSEIFSSDQIRKKIIVSITILFFVQFISETALRFNSVFWEKGMEEQIVYAEKGPEKGIRMTKEKLEYYTFMTKDIEPIKSDQNIKQVLFLINDPLLYLISEKGIASYSPWLPVSSDTIHKNDEYFHLYPDKIPDAVYIPRENEIYLSHFTDMGFSSIDVTDEGNFILLRENQ